MAHSSSRQVNGGIEIHFCNAIQGTMIAALYYNIFIQNKLFERTGYGVDFRRTTYLIRLIFDIERRLAWEGH